MGSVGLLLLVNLGLTYAFSAPSAGLLSSASPHLYKHALRRTLRQQLPFVVDMVKAPPAPMVAHQPGSWRVIYFDAPNRGEQVRMLLALASQPFADVRLRFPEGLDPYKTAALGDESPLLGTDKCPAVTSPDGKHCIETAEIMRFVGQKVDLAPPAGSSEDARAMEMCLLAQEIMNKVFYPLLKPMVIRELLGSFLGPALVGREATYLPEPRAFLSDALRTIEGTLGASGGPYVCGAKLCYADVAIFAILNEVLAYECLDRAAVLEPHARVAFLLADLETKTQAWVDFRVREHQLGIRSTVKFFAATNTPFPWSRRAFPPSRKAEESSWPPAEQGS